MYDLVTYQFVRPDHPRHELEVWEAYEWLHL